MRVRVRNWAVARVAAALCATTAATAAVLTVTPSAPSGIAPPAGAASPASGALGAVMPRLKDSQASQLRRMLEGAPGHGLPSYAKALTSGAPDDPALIQAVMDYAHAVHGGRLREGDYLADWGMRPTGFDPWPSFVAAVKEDRLATWIASLPPPYTGYDGLRRGLATYRALASDGGWKVIPEGPELALGATGPRVAALRKRLAAEDSGVDAKGPDKFDAGLVEAVRRAQKRYGLEPVGRVGKGTLAALNVPASDRVDSIVANLERWRWLPAQLPADRIQINIAAAVLTMFKGDAPATSMKVVTGRPGDHTPMLSSQIHSIVLNPPWNVPTSIATKELWPKERANRGYLKRSGFKVISTGEGRSRLQQAPGPNNSLGRIKFDFDNKYSVYLHDTPSRGAFERYSRLASHGCVRLERPLDLAKLLLQDDPAWAGDAVDSVIAVGDTKRVRLTKPLAVYLLYWTAFAGSNGQMNFRDDPYEWDGTLASKIGAGKQVTQVATR
ncbi:MAG: putative peptidoglycan binding domain protein [Sphingomonas bacterium]|nr:putative peptidoglycan binding domain protein [Sphingomonas bacterium]